jgi:hypothetical protein
MLSTTKQDLDSFSETYLEGWDARATVRSMSRFRPGPESAGVELMPAEFVPALFAPELGSIGAEARDYLLTQKAYAMLEGVARHETDNVTAFATQMANGRYQVDLPRSTRQVLLTVAVDEPYHALAAREFMDDIVRIKGIEPLAQCYREEDRNHVAYRRAAERVPQDLRRDFTVIALCLFENLITDEAFNLARTAAHENPMKSLHKEHMIDESRHSAFFRRLLSYYWQGLEIEARQAISPAVPCLLDACYGEMDDWLAFDCAALVAVGFDPETVDRVVPKSFEGFDKRRVPMWKNTRRALEESGMIEDEVVFTALEAGGWLGDSANGATVDTSGSDRPS